MTTRTRPIPAPPPRLRQRYSPSRTEWRIWWEPCRTARALGFSPVELDPARPTWSVRQAETLNAQLRGQRGTSAPRPAAAHTICALIERYRASPRFRDGLKPATRADYESAFRHVAGAFGTRQAASIRKPEMAEWYEALYPRGATQAKRLVRAASILFSYAETIGWIAEGSNPCARLALVTPPPRERVATWTEVGALLQVCAMPGMVHGVSPGMLVSVGAAVSLATYHGQRQADVLPVRIDALQGDVWRVARSKTGQAGAFELHEFARPWVARAREMAADAGADRLIVYEGTGKPYTSADHFRQVFGRVRTRAAAICPSVGDLQFRDLRRTASQMARLGGADGFQTGDLLGNASARDPRLSVTYMPATDTAATAAVRAIQPPPELAIFPEVS